jgi:hypothetical protein
MPDDRASGATDHGTDNCATSSRAGLITNHSADSRAGGRTNYSATLLLTHSSAACQYYRARQEEPDRGSR